MKSVCFEVIDYKDNYRVHIPQKIYGESIPPAQREILNDLSIGFVVGVNNETSKKYDIWEVHPFSIFAFIAVVLSL